MPCLLKDLFELLLTCAGCGHLSGLFGRGTWPLALMKSANQIPIKQSSRGAQAAPLGGPDAVQFDHRHSRLSLHPGGRNCSAYLA